MKKIMFFLTILCSANLFSAIYCPEKISCNSNSWCDIPSSWNGSGIHYNVKLGDYYFWYATGSTKYQRAECAYSRGKGSSVIISSNLFEPDFKINQGWQLDSEATQTYKCKSSLQSPYQCPLKNR